MRQKKIKRKDIDLLVAYNKKKEPSKYASLVKLIIPPVALAVVMLGIYGILIVQSNGIQQNIDDTNAKIKEVEKKIENDPNIAKAKTLEELTADTEKYKKLYEDIQSYPQLSQNTFDQIVIAADAKLSITGFNYARSSEYVTISVETASQSNIEQFVRNLKASGTFADVTYTGYSGQEKASGNGAATAGDLLSGLTGSATNSADTTPKETVYVGAVQCLLK